jgi:polyisoprenoid-binding protein YceI
MQAPSGQADAPTLRSLLNEGTLAGEWTLDTRASSIRLKSRSMGLITVTGVFRELTGKGTVSASGPAGATVGATDRGTDGGAGSGSAGSGSVTIAAASIDTGNARRDAHLRSADFFDTDDNPDITFTASGIRPAGRGVAVAGTLTVRGTARPLSFDAAVSVHGDGEIWLDTEVRVNRGDFGITWNTLGLMSMTSIVTVHAVFTRG